MAYPDRLPANSIKANADAFEWWKQALLNEDVLEGFSNEDFYQKIGVHFPTGSFTRGAFYTWIRNYWPKPPTGHLYTYDKPVLDGSWNKDVINAWGRAKLFELNLFGNVTNGGDTSKVRVISITGRYGVVNWTKTSLMYMRFGFSQFLEYGGITVFGEGQLMYSNSTYIAPTVLSEIDVPEEAKMIKVVDVTHNSARVEILDYDWFNNQDKEYHRLYYRKESSSTWSYIDNALTLTGLDGSTAYQVYIMLMGQYTTVGGSNTENFATEVTPYLTLSRSSITVNADVTSFTFNIDSNLSWTITDNRDWISVNTSSGSGDRNGIVVSFPQNTGGQRSGTITVKGGGITRTITVTQRAVQVHMVVLKSATSELGPYQGASTPDAAMNNVYSHNMYSTVNSHLNYQPGTRFFINSSASQPMNASGWFRIADTTYAVQIDTIGYFIALVNTAESVAISPTSRTVEHSTNSTSFNISSNTSWTISTNASWVTLNKSSGTGNTTVTASFGNNTGSSDRTATITLKSTSGYRQATATLRQSKEVVFTISPTQYNFPHNLAGSFNITVTATGSWTASGVGDVYSLLPNSGNGNGVIGVMVGGNNDQFPKISSVEVISGGVSRVCNIVVPGTGFGGMMNPPYNTTPPETLEGMTIEGELKDNDNE